MKNRFIEIFKRDIKREGADKFLDWLLTTDFFNAPASSNFHSAYKGGLCEHSLKVYDRFEQLLKYQFGDDFEKNFSRESLAICALLHDVCKVDTYKEDLKNVKKDGSWIQVPFYSVRELLPYGHGEKSVYIINGFMRLTREEAMIINWHMGGFDLRVKGGSYALSDVFYAYPTAVLLHTADMHATYFDETRPER